MREIADIHYPFIAWLKKMGIPYHRQHDGKRSTGQKGDPDFLVTWCSHCVYIECKVPGNALSPDQEERRKFLQRAGNKVVVAYSLDDCIEACKNILCVGEANLPVPQASNSIGDGLSGRAALEAATPTRGGQTPQRDSSAGDTAGLYLANIGGQEWVLRQDPQTGVCSRVRLANPADVINIRRFSHLNGAAR
jgi:hypothetical protein